MPHQPLTRTQRLYARGLRRDQTAEERLLWKALRGRRFVGFKFRRQHPVGPFVVDFFCLERKLAIELDGGGHAGDTAVAHDRERTSWLAKQSVRELRFWNTDVHGNLEGVLQAIAAALTQAPSPAPPAASRPLPPGEAKRQVPQAPSPAPPAASRPLPPGEA
ncbi:MAG TPA: endonuclease domain-containing protein [Thermoanaerobaculia bacterium]|nr:endonuclease domain-containing protein [Thermoanaerobaculia bacterium]